MTFIASQLRVGGGKITFKPLGYAAGYGNPLVIASRAYDHLRIATGNLSAAVVGRHINFFHAAFLFLTFIIFSDNNQPRISAQPSAEPHNPHA